ncbi:MAG: hypothetical protein C0501_23065 [Isosphaera sp.]|nr:hypothetical protein [Isosphaera sp.]
MSAVPPPDPTDDPLPDLVRGLRGHLPLDRLRAARHLGRLGWLARDALPALRAALADDDPRVREAVAQAVGQMGPGALPAIAGMLAHQDKYVRRHAVWAIGRLGPAARPVLADLCAALRDPDPRTGSGAAQALGNLGAGGADAVPALTEAMRGTNIVLCRLAAKALSQIGPPALAALVAHLQHSDPFVRGEAALALGWMGAPARSAVPLLAAAVRGPRSRDGRPLDYTPPPVRSRAPDDDPDESPTPTHTPAPTASGTPEETCRVHAAQALGRIGPPAAAALDDLWEAAQTGPDAVRRAALHAVKQIQGT